jgi:hypothetical protein
MELGHRQDCLCYWKATAKKERGRDGSQELVACGPMGLAAQAEAYAT